MMNRKINVGKRELLIVLLIIFIKEEKVERNKDHMCFYSIY